MITFYDTDVESEILNLPDGLLARFVHYAELMKTHGSNLGMPHTRAMGKGLFELRLKAEEGIGRIFYCVVVDRRIVMLHSFVKKSQKTPHKELDIVRKRWRKLKNA